MFRFLRESFLAALLLINLVPVLHAQNSASPQTRCEAQRDKFIQQIKAMGYSPSLPAPTIILDNPRSFGNYDDSTNTLHTCDWNTLPAGEKAFFQDFAQKIGNGMTAQIFFDKVVYHWIFIHELGHWWRACEHQTATPYDEETAANRIASAYWHEMDPAFYTFMVGIFQGFVDHMPSPVPAGQSKEQYLNDNYQKLPGGDSYSWYQSIMNVEVSKEQPFESFKQAVQYAGKPILK